MLPKVQAFPSASQQDMAVAIEFERGEHLGDLSMGWQEVKEQLRAAVFRLQSLVLPWGFIGAKRGGEKKSSGHSVFFRKNNHSNYSLCSCIYSWGRKLPKVGTGRKQRVSHCALLSSLLTHPFPEGFGILCLGWFVCWGVVLFFSAFQTRAAQPDKRVVQAQTKCACP